MDDIEYIGSTYDKRRKRWLARVRGRPLGFYSSNMEAALMHDVYLFRENKEIPKHLLNFPPSEFS
jgi:hypothetical protein